MVQPKKTWILVCDASRARLLRAEQGKRGTMSLVQVEAFEHAESRARARDLMADAVGRKPAGAVPAGAGVGQGAAYGRPGAEPDTDPREVEAQKFARELAGALDKGMTERAYERLFLIAPPHFLGLLRAAVSTQVERSVALTLDKDLTNEDLRELTERLAPDLSAP